jgi:glutathione synthase/RimK-type ligase-like ATP-grasp enzyme
MIECIIATCGDLPELDPDDRLFATALADLGVKVTPGVWDDPSVDWGATDFCVIRSTWDYHKHHAAFARWIEFVSSKTRLFNPAHAVRWNAHKFYLRDLESRGIPVVPTAWLERGSRVELHQLLDGAGWQHAVIKPAYGASSDGVLRVGTDRIDRERGQAYLTRLLAEQDVLVQPYLDTISVDHERALVFIDGKYSHAVTKTPFMHANADLARRSQYPPGVSGELPVEATGEEVAAACRALEAGPDGHVYGRVDVVRDGGAIRVMEVELIEPTLYFCMQAGAAQKLARAILERVRP